MQARLAVAFGLLSLVAVIASALLTLHLDSRRAELEAERRMATAASFTTTLLMAERDRNRINAQEIASRTMVQQLVQSRDSPGLSRLLAGLRQVVRDDLLAIYASDGTYLAGDAMPELFLDEPSGLVRGALAGTAGVATLNNSGHLMIAAAAPITVNNDIIGAVLASDLLDERFARRMSNSADMTVALATENGQTIATEPLSGPLLTTDHWSALKTRGDVWLRSAVTARPLRALARPLLGGDFRPVGAIVLGLPEANIVPIEQQDVLLYVIANGALLVGLWTVGGLAAWGFSRRVGRATVWAADTTVSAPVLASLKAGPSSVAGDGPASGKLVNDDDQRRLADLTIDRTRRTVHVGERDILLTPTEFELLWTLAAQPGHVVTRDDLLIELRGDDWQAEPGLLDTHVSNLRRKIEPDPAHPRYVLTVRGVGYKMPDDLDLAEATLQ